MKRSLIAAALALAAFSALASPAEARRHRPADAPQPCNSTADVMRPCSIDANFLRGVRSIRVQMHRVSDGAAIVAHPAGCPARAFCGCGAAVHIFGRPIRALWLAAAWFKFPRAAPAPGMAAVRRHHVFVLEQHLGGSTWLTYDANSGGHATRIHARSIAGYTIVDPRA
jgi:hypothetical protein